MSAFKRALGIDEAELVFLEGAHAGARVALPADRHILGAGDDAALTFSEETEAEGRLLLDLRWPMAPFGPHLALESGVAYLNETPLEAGRRIRLRTGDAVRLGETVFAYGDPAREGGGGSGLKSAFAVGALALIGAVMLWFGGGWGARETAPAPVAAQPAALSENQTLEAAEALSGRLDAAGIAALDVEPVPEARIVRVTGPMDVVDRNAWGAVRLWFDATYGGSVSLDARFSDPVREVVLPFTFRSVWLKPEPVVITNDGVRRRVGDILPGGWKIIAIDEDAVVIEKEKKRLTLTL